MRLLDKPVVLIWPAVGAVVGFFLVSAMSLTPGRAGGELDLSAFDPDVYPAIDVSHRVPTVVDEDLVSLEFDFACGYWDTGTSCVPEGLLHVGYGNEFSEVPLSEVDRDSLRVLVAEVPATDNAGGSLEYYLDVTDSVGGVSVRYPTTGAISPFVAHNPVDVSLGTAEHVPGDRILFFPWGADADSVGIDKGSEQATLGPQAIDVTPTGDALAILDGVNRRVVITDLATKDMVSVSVDTILGDVDIDHQRTLTVLDSIGVASGDGPPIPQAKVYTRDGLLLRQTGVFTEVAAQLDAEAEVIGIDQRVVAPFDAADRPLGRAAQRAAADSASLAVYFRHDGTVLVADRVSNMAFTVTAEDGVGPISLFARSADGYVLAFQGVETMRIAWFDSSGTVDRYVSVPAHSYAESNPLTRVAASTEGDVFVLSSTVDGAEVLEVGGSE